jgi:hypothetical protein
LECVAAGKKISVFFEMVFVPRSDCLFKSCWEHCLFKRIVRIYRMDDVLDISWKVESWIIGVCAWTSRYQLQVRTLSKHSVGWGSINLSYRSWELQNSQSGTRTYGNMTVILRAKPMWRLTA